MDIFSKIKSAFQKKEKAVSDGSAYSSFQTIISASNVNGGNLLLNNKEWVFIAVDKVAKAVSSVRFKVMKYEKNGDDKEVYEGDLVRFMEKPGNKFTGKDFAYLTTVYKELTGNAFWNIKDKKDVKPLVATGVSPIVSRETQELKGYKYQFGGSTKTFLVDEVAHDRYADPSNPYWGVGKLSKIAGWVDTSVYANEFLRLFFVNGAQFGGFFETDEESMERIKLIKAGLVNEHKGVANAHKIGVLPKNTKFTPATATMQDSQFAEMDDKTRDKILSGFGVPKTLVGLTTDVNRASAEASEYIFAKYTVKPIVDGYVEFLNEYIVPLFDTTGQYYVAYDEFIPQNEEIMIRENQAALANGAYKTINEVRAEHGLPKITGGDVVFGNPFGAPIGSPEKSIEPKPKKIRAKKFTKRDIVDEIAEKAIKAVEDANADNKEVVDEAKHKEFVSRVTQYQKQMAEKIRDFNQRQKREVLAKLQTITKAVTKDDIFDYETEVELMVDLVTPLLTGLLTEQAIKEWEEQGFAGAFNPTEENIAKIIADSAERMSESYNDTTLNLIKSALNTGIQNGESIAELTARVADVYAFSDQARALQVAHTETFFTANEASSLAYKQSGVVKTIRWYTSQDHRVCEFCGPLHGEIIDVQDDFFKKGQTVYGENGGTLKLDYRSINVPPLHPNCNCFIRPEEIVVGS